ncbi:membrane protein [Methylogaea oryzae]|uniref:Membrane protein n=1 Tax=Methylogaea oryzae TaxID=1295382 RepID=A0A8D4VS52_9GAMM|nr:membrane protein [Methylogaea oryzae]
MIGIAAAALLYVNGRIAGISNICAGLFPPVHGGRGWRVAFIAGLLAGGLALSLLYPAAFPAASSASPLKLAVAGLLVGLGARLANGCTSGHGICGLARLSKRSLAATAVFMSSGMATVFFTHGGNP